MKKLLVLEGTKDLSDLAIFKSFGIQLQAYLRRAGDSEAALVKSPAEAAKNPVVKADTAHSLQDIFSLQGRQQYIEDHIIQQAFILAFGK